MAPVLPGSEWLLSWPARARIDDLDQGPAIVVDAIPIGMTDHVIDHVVAADPDGRIEPNGPWPSIISVLDAGILRRPAESSRKMVFTWKKYPRKDPLLNQSL